MSMTCGYLSIENYVVPYSPVLSGKPRIRVGKLENYTLDVGAIKIEYHDEYRKKSPD
jgi:hypothetical protein